ncbi:asparagine synthase (glutamine-hydrolyzing) [Cytophagaceae bacterium ABcell3]|nr:asparagine synthase (glutamine-hydrolyzing) [Cytophagaceae bacterium ABcell3]
MCGISVFFDKRNSYTSDIIVKMLRAIDHRGPDNVAFKSHSFLSGKIYLGASRLRISELSSRSDQPFVSDDDNFCLVYNGEIYQVEGAGVNGSDTELLFRLLIKSGVSKSISALKGMFAFAFLDNNAQKLSICRDFAGIKPMYYYEDDRVFLAASEIRSILASGLLEKQLNREAVENYLLYKYANAPQTFYKDIYELPPGGVLETGRRGTFRSLYPQEDMGTSKSLDKDKKGLVKSCGQVLENSFLEMVPSEVPAGIFYSGGVDSSLLLAYTAKHKLSLPAFTISCISQEGSFNTSGEKHASELVKKLGLQHHFYSMGSEVLGQLPDYITHTDQPVADSAGFVTWKLSEFAKQHVDVAFSGAGADEYFGGYHRHQAFQFYLDHLYGTKLRIMLLKHFSKLLPDGLDMPFRERIRLFKKFLANLHPSYHKTWDNFISVKGFEFLQKAQPNEDFDELYSYGMRSDRNAFLPYDVLKVTDYFAMQHSLEVRVPFLHQDVVNFGNQLSPDVLLKYGKKWILKDLLQQETLGKYKLRRKEGFGMPIGAWIREKKNYFLVEQILTKDHLLYDQIDFERVQRLVNNHLAHKGDYSTALWSLITLTGWLSKEFSS